MAPKFPPSLTLPAHTVVDHPRHQAWMQGGTAHAIDDGMDPRRRTLANWLFAAELAYYRSRAAQDEAPSDENRLKLRRAIEELALAEAAAV